MCYGCCHVYRRNHAFGKVRVCEEDFLLAGFELPNIQPDFPFFSNYANHWAGRAPLFFQMNLFYFLVSYFGNEWVSKHLRDNDFCL